MGCQPPVWQEFPLETENKRVNDTMPGEEDGQDRGSGRGNATRRKEERVTEQCCSPHRVVAKSNEWCQGGRYHSSEPYVWKKRREGLGVQTLVDRSNLQLSGCRAFVLDGARCFHDKVQGRTDGHPQGPKLNGIVTDMEVK